MKRLSGRRLEKVLAFLRETHGAHDLDSFAQIVPSALTRLITADVATYSEVNPLRKRVGWHYQPGTIPLFDFRSAFERFMHTDPLVLHYASGADGQATKISDLMTQRQFRSLPIYSEFYRHLGLQHQIAFLLDTVVPLPVSETREGDTNIAPPSSIVDPGATVRSRFIGQAAIARARAATGV